MLLLTLLLVFLVEVSSWTSNGVADPSQIIRIGHARFTLITEAIVRMEYSDDDQFDNSPTLSTLNRKVKDKISFSHTIENGLLTIDTPYWELKFDPLKSTHSSGANTYGFHGENLVISLKVAPFSVWTMDSASSGNMHGTIRTLDRADRSIDLTCIPPTDQLTFYSHCEEGLVSRDGWVLVDDSFRIRLTENTTWYKPLPEVNRASLYGRAPPGYADLYFHGFGFNFQQAVSDYIRMSGPIPQLPNYALGAGFSRWYAWNQPEEEQLVDSFSSNGFPLDMLSLDMDVFKVYPRGLANPWNVNVDGWTGYTVDRDQFPNFRGLMSRLARRGVHVNANLHPAAGIQFPEESYQRVCEFLQLDCSQGAVVPFDSVSQRYMDAFLGITLQPLSVDGLRFFWIDFQSGAYSKELNLNPTIWLNHQFWINKHRYVDMDKLLSAQSMNKDLLTKNLTELTKLPEVQGGSELGIHRFDRPFLMGRWGGLGGHRTPIGFAGDTSVSWEMLRYELYFCPTAANVGFQWSTDIGGFEGAPEPQLVVRWAQWGALSSAMRMHSSKQSPSRVPWSHPHPYLGEVRRAFHLRARLLPYLKGLQNMASTTGLQSLRPVYWKHPLSQAAYRDSALHEFYLGEDIFAAPVASPLTDDGSLLGLTGFDKLGADIPGPLKSFRSGDTGRPFNKTASQLSGRVQHGFWLPPGPWIEWGSWQAIHFASGAEIDREYIGSVSNKNSKFYKDFASEEWTVNAAGIVDLNTNTNNNINNVNSSNNKNIPVTSETAGKGTYVVRNYTLSEIPMFSRPGSIIPLRTLPDGSLLGIASRPLDALTLLVFPITSQAVRDFQKSRKSMKAEDGHFFDSFSSHAEFQSEWPLLEKSLYDPLLETLIFASHQVIYDDDGATVDYQRNKHAQTLVACVWVLRDSHDRDSFDPARPASAVLQDIMELDAPLDDPMNAAAYNFGRGYSVRCGVSRPIGSFEGQPQQRQFTFRFPGQFIPYHVSHSVVSTSWVGSNHDEGRKRISFPRLSDWKAALVSSERDDDARPDNDGYGARWRNSASSTTAVEDKLKSFWSFDGTSSSLWVNLPQANTQATVIVNADFEGPPTAPELTNGHRRSVDRFLRAKSIVDKHYGLVYPIDVVELLNASSLLTGVSYYGDNEVTLESLILQMLAIRQLDQFAETLLQSFDKSTQKFKHNVLLEALAHMMGSLYDVTVPVRPVKISSHRFKELSKEISFRTTISYLKTSNAGDIM